MFQFCSFCTNVILTLQRVWLSVPIRHTINVTEVTQLLKKWFSLENLINCVLMDRIKV